VQSIINHSDRDSTFSYTYKILYVLDKEKRDWIESVNKWAMNNITERLLEANQRGMWQTDNDRLRELRKVYIETEGSIEEVY